MPCSVEWNSPQNRDDFMSERDREREAEQYEKVYESERERERARLFSR